MEYKFTDPGGFWKMTKGYTGHGLKEMTSGQYLRLIEMCKLDLAAEHKAQSRSRGRPKKVYTKYKGE